MTLRSVFIADGPSDLPLADHLERLCAEQGREVEVTPIDPRLVEQRGRAIADRLALVLQQGLAPDLVFIHRDAEAQPPEQRRAEISAGARSLGLATERVVPVVPVRMTEAWLLLDEATRTAQQRRAGGELPEEPIHWASLTR